MCPRFLTIRLFPLAGLIVLLSGCGPKPDEAPPKAADPHEAVESIDPGKTIVHFVGDRLGIPIRAVQMGILERLIRTRPELELIASDAQGNAELQVKQIEDGVKNRAKFLLVLPVDGDAIAPALRAARTRGVKVIALSARVPADARDTVVQVDQEKLGTMAGDYALAALRQKAKDEGSPVVTGRVVQLRGTEDDSNSNALSSGFLKALSAEPGIRLVHDAPAYWNEAAATQRMNEALRLQNRFEVVFAHNDIIGQGASNAAKAAGAPVRNQMLILGIDGLPGKNNGMDKVLNGELDATLYQPVLVDQAWMLISNLLDSPDSPLSPIYEMKPVVITPENAARQLAAGLPSIEAEPNAATPPPQK